MPRAPTEPTPRPNGTLLAADAAGIAAAAAELARGGIVAVPTETVYGLAADARDAAAVARVYAAKRRPAFNPLIVHVADLAAAEALARFDPVALLLAERFWPGPLTLVLPLRVDSGIAALVTAGLDTIALRVPAHPVMQALLAACGAPLAAPSANPSGRLSPTRVSHVVTGLGTDVPVLDGGPSEAGIESTIVAPRDGRIDVLRPGPVTREALAQATGLDVVLSYEHAPDVQAPSAPGQFASHYAPRKPLELLSSEAITLSLSKGVRDPTLCLVGFGAMPCDINLSEGSDVAEAAARLFDALYAADAGPATRIAVAPIPESGLGRAINDRLRRAATVS